MQKPLIMGATEYSAKVPELWQGFKDYFRSKGLDYDFRLFPTYEQTVLAHVGGETDISWHSPFAWVEIERLAASRGRVAQVIGMRDTDLDNSSFLLVRRDGAINRLDDLRGTTMGVGAPFSAETTLIPFDYLQRHGLRPYHDFQPRRFVPPKALGCQIGNSLAAVQALAAGELASCWVRNGQYRQFLDDGSVIGDAFAVLAETEVYDHCNFSMISDRKHPLTDDFVALLLDMSPDDPQVRALFDLEGLNRWMPGRSSGYVALHRAAERFGMPDEIAAAIRQSA